MPASAIPGAVPRAEICQWPYVTAGRRIAKAIPTLEAALQCAQELQRLQASEARLSQALDTANTVNFAVGILSERHRIDRHRAFELMRDQARSERRKVKEIAREILDATDYINRFGSDPS